MKQGSRSESRQQTADSQQAEIVPIEAFEQPQRADDRRSRVTTLYRLIAKLTPGIQDPIVLGWSFLVALPLIVGGLLILQTNTPFPTALAYPPLALGSFVWVGGVVTHLSAPPWPQTYQGERILASTTPTRRVAAAKTVFGLAGIGLGTVLLLNVSIPLAYPILTLLGGTYLYSRNIFQFWVNSLTRYFLTTQRLIRGLPVTQCSDKIRSDGSNPGDGAESNALRTDLWDWARCGGVSWRFANLPYHGPRY
jgi:hypothetical protein